MLSYVIQELQVCFDKVSQKKRRSKSGIGKCRMLVTERDELIQNWPEVATFGLNNSFVNYLEMYFLVTLPMYCVACLFICYLLLVYY